MKCSTPFYRPTACRSLIVCAAAGAVRSGRPCDVTAHSRHMAQTRPRAQVAPKLPDKRSQLDTNCTQRSRTRPCSSASSPGLLFTHLTMEVHQSIVDKQRHLVATGRNASGERTQWSLKRRMVDMWLVGQLSRVTSFDKRFYLHLHHSRVLELKNTKQNGSSPHPLTSDRIGLVLMVNWRKQLPSQQLIGRDRGKVRQGSL